VKTVYIGVKVNRIDVRVGCIGSVGECSGVGDGRIGA
jgi:hypothetical protein